jgi:5-methyltetrahydropteroyltriglutamate--homocysteine methyltransferase
MIQSVAAKEQRSGERAKPPFRADHVGSLLRPAKLRAAREARKRGEITSAELRLIEDAAIREIVALQEALGFKVVTDGEFRRNWFHIDFLEKISNITVVPPSFNLRFHTHEGDIEVVAPGLRVDGKLSRPSGIFVEDFKFLKSVTRVVPKLAIPSPSTVHFRGGRAAVSTEAYPDIEEFYADLGRAYSEEVRDLAKAGCRYLQIDEVNIAFLCDPALREKVRGIGEDPSALLHSYAQLINRSIVTRPPDMTVCIHLCRGNFSGAWLAEGGYDPVAEALFNEIEADGYLLEYDSPRAGGFEPLRHVPKGKMVVLGLLTTKSGKLENKDELKRRIDEASRYISLDQLGLSPQCGFSSHIDSSVVTAEDQRAKLALVAEVAREVWG